MVTIEDLEVSWVTAVTEFVEASPWLGPQHLPQLKALMAIAKELDTGKSQAALISQFTLTQRTLMGKAPDGNGAGGGDLPPALPGLEGEDWSQPVLVDAD